MEIFRRVVPESELDAVFNAGRGGKCKSWSAVPQTTGLCEDEVSATVPVQLFNAGIMPQTYTLSAIGLGSGTQFAGQTSNIAGPTVFSFNPATPVTLQPGDSATVQLAIQRPVDMDAQGERSAYQVVMADQNGGAFHRIGFLLDVRDDCMQQLEDVQVAYVALTYTTTFAVKNNTATAKTYDLTWRVEDSSGALDISTFSLAGLPPGEPYLRSVTLPPGAETTVRFLFSAVRHESQRSYDIVLYADLDGDGYAEAIAANPVRTANGSAIDVPALGGPALLLLAGLLAAYGVWGVRRYRVRRL